MIKFASADDFFDIIKLWKNVFGDSEKMINDYLSRFGKNVLIFREGKSLCGMLSLLPISNGKSVGFYVYAVATDKSFRSRGIASRLIEYSKELCGNDKFLILTPASESLFGFYKKFGFYEISCIEKYIAGLEVSDEIIPVSEISPTELLIFRKECFKGFSFFEWDIDVLKLMKDCFGYCFLALGNNLGFAVCEVFENMVNIKELCCQRIYRQAALASVCRYFGCDLYSYVIPSKTAVPSSMVWGKSFKKPYFNLSLD